MIAIVDYDTGNLRSVCNSLYRLNADFIVTSDSSELRRASHLILPGVGEASTAMAKLRERRLDLLLPTLTQPVLGICIGMQLMCLSSEEGWVDCMGIFPARVKKLVGETGEKIPHMGWNSISESRSCLFDGIACGSYFYYVHSYAAELCDNTVATTDYCSTFSAAMSRDNFFGCQFHPEKSGANGTRLLQNFLKL